MVRPTREIDYKTVEKLASIACADSEIAHVIGFTPEWICKRKKTDEKLAKAIERGREKGRAALRRLQWNLANKGNATMLIWLGKQLLGQRDEARTVVAGEQADGQTSFPVTIRIVEEPLAPPITE